MGCLYEPFRATHSSSSQIPTAFTWALHRGNNSEQGQSGAGQERNNEHEKLPRLPVSDNMSGSAHNRLGATYFAMLPSNISSLSSASKLPPVRVLPLLRAAPPLRWNEVSLTQRRVRPKSLYSHLPELLVCAPTRAKKFRPLLLHRGAPRFPARVRQLLQCSPPPVWVVVIWDKCTIVIVHTDGCTVWLRLLQVYGGGNSTQAGGEKSSGR